mgnify:CR=1 FL=1
MGGYGSGRFNWHQKATTVEESKEISITDFMKRGAFEENQLVKGSIKWKSGSTIGIATKQLDNGRLYLELNYRFQDSDEEIKIPISFTKTKPHFGGVRWWFICPLTVNGRSCFRRVSKLYLPPGEKYFGCRLCHRLTYKSCQESHQYDRVFAMVALQAGLPFSQVKRAMNEMWKF